MRTAILSYTAVFTLFLMIIILSNITMKSSYSEQISQSLDSSIEYATKMLQQDRSLVRDKSDYYVNDVTLTYEDGTLSDVKEDFIYYLTEKLDSRIKHLDVKFDSGSDTNSLSVKVTATFEYPSGKEDKVIYYKTMILEKKTKI
jgi:hypothetical protein